MIRYSAKGAFASALFILSALALAPAHATAIPFTATGSFQDGSTLSGFVTIDTATGLIGAADLAISGRPVHFTTIALQRTFPLVGPLLTEFEFANGQTTDNLLTFLLPPVSLIGYNGGLLCGTVNAPSCFDGTLHYQSNFATKLQNGGIPANTFVTMTEGSLTPSAVPEPSTWALACIAGISMVRRRVKHVGH